MVHPQSEVVFENIPKKVLHSSISISNLTNKKVAFKVFSSQKWLTSKIKTTSPKLYVVKPNQDILDPNQTIKAEFHMQPLVIFLSLALSHRIISHLRQMQMTSS
jgi:VAMP-associated protein involved in inositol metabolism